jgi:hypothetical protein
MNKNEKIMAQYPTQRLIDHRDFGFAPQAVAKLPLHHAKGGFNVRPLVVLREEIVNAEIESSGTSSPTLRCRCHDGETRAKSAASAKSLRSVPVLQLY